MVREASEKKCVLGMSAFTTAIVPLRIALKQPKCIKVTQGGAGKE